MASQWTRSRATPVAPPTCERCGTTRSPNDARILDAAIRCRACGAIAPLDEPSPVANPVDRAEDVWTPHTPPVERPQHSGVELTDDGQRLVISRRVGNALAGSLVLLWLIVWTVGCAMLVIAFVAQPSVGAGLFVILFVTTWFGLTALVNWQLFGCETLTIDERQITVTKHAPSFARRQRASLNAHVRICGCFEPGEYEDSPPQDGIEIRTGDKPLRFGVGLSDAERVWITDVLRRRLQRSVPHRSVASARYVADESVRGEDSRDTEAWRRPHPRPALTTVEMREELDGLVFTRENRHDYPLHETLTGIGICLIWNSGVSIFLWALLSGEGTEDMKPAAKWLMAVPLVPFVYIGFRMLWAALLHLARLASVREWHIGRDLAERYCVVGLASTRRREWQQVCEVELLSSRIQSATCRNNPESHAESYRLAFLAENGEVLLCFRGLTENEARWILGEIHTRYPRWLRGAECTFE
jgi:hypothetical protein